MIARIDKLLTALFTVLKALLCIILIAMVVILIAHIFCRYVLNNSLTWSEELLKIMLVWFGMLSVTILAARREHVSIVVFKNKMPEKVSAFFGIFTQVITFLICLVIIAVGIRYVITAGYRPTPALRLPYSYAYAAIPVSFFFISLYEFRNMLVEFRGNDAHAVIEKPEDDLT